MLLEAGLIELLRRVVFVPVAADEAAAAGMSVFFYFCNLCVRVYSGSGHFTVDSTRCPWPPLLVTRVCNFVFLLRVRVYSGYGG